MVATIWTESPSWRWAEVCERAGLEAASGGRLRADQDLERNVDGFARMLAKSGWVDPDVRERPWMWEAPTTALWRSVEGGVAGAGSYYLGLDRHDRRRFRNGFDALSAERAVQGILSLEHAAAIAVARRGSGPARN